MKTKLIRCNRSRLLAQYLLYRSKDTFVKFWDLDTQHCFRTLLTHKTEVYGLLLNPEETRLYTGSADNEMRVYKIRYLTDEENLANKVCM